MSDEVELVWERVRLGLLAPVLRKRISRVLADRQDLSVAAHVAGSLRTNHTYGATQRNGLEQDLADLAEDISGLVVRTVGGVALLVVEETGTVIYPYRYAKSRREQRTQAVMSAPMSEVRKVLFVQDIPPVSDQLTLEEGQLTEEELADHEAEVTDRRAAGQVGARVVVLGYGSDPSGSWGLGWGEIEVRDPLSPQVEWIMWVPLDAAVAATQLGAGSLQVVNDLAPAGPSFDDGTPVDSGFELTMRPDPSGPAPADEPAGPQPDTGTDSAEPGQ